MRTLPEGSLIIILKQEFWEPGKTRLEISEFLVDCDGFVGVYVVSRE
jgi:hypothetical protein